MDPYVFMICAAAAVVLIGCILIGFDHHLEKKRDDEMKYFIRCEMTPVIKETVKSVLSDGMDLIPEKLSEIRKDMEGGEV